MKLFLPLLNSLSDFILPTAINKSQTFTNTTQKIMADNRTQIDPRYLKYDRDEVEQILGKMDNAGLASEADVRAIASASHPEPDTEP